ncbi:hypothetical protein GGI12_003965 [Dipsacomyces acuminosporus]|nr:hypothetical protein GGI12_003965 [Dipsacomyces acuminosporus]
MARAMQINWFSYPATTFLNFLVFLTDPVMQSVINEVRKSIAAKLTKTSGLSKLEPRKNYGFSSTIDGSTIANISITAETIRDDETCSNLSVATEEKQYKLSHADTLAELEEDSHRLLDDIEMHEGAKLKQL